MSPLATVQALYRAFKARDRAAILRLFHPEIVWIQNAGFPNGGTHVGAIAVLDGVFARFRQDWSELGAEVEEWLESGDAIVALGFYHGVHAATGRAMRADFAHVYRVRDGCIVRFQQFTDTHSVRQAMSP